MHWYVHDEVVTAIILLNRDKLAAQGRHHVEVIQINKPTNKQTGQRRRGAEESSAGSSSEDDRRHSMSIPISCLFLFFLYLLD